MVEIAISFLFTTKETVNSQTVKTILKHVIHLCAKIPLKNVFSPKKHLY